MISPPGKMKGGHYKGSAGYRRSRSQAIAGSDDKEVGGRRIRRSDNPSSISSFEVNHEPLSGSKGIGGAGRLPDLRGLMPEDHKNEGSRKITGSGMEGPTGTAGEGVRVRPMLTEHPADFRKELQGNCRTMCPTSAQIVVGSFYSVEDLPREEAPSFVQVPHWGVLRNTGCAGDRRSARERSVLPKGPVTGLKGLKPEPMRFQLRCRGMM